MARGAAEDGEGAGDVCLGADDGPYEGGLPAAARPEQAGDAAAGDREGEVVEHGAATADDAEAGRLDGGFRVFIHHAVNKHPQCFRVKAAAGVSPAAAGGLCDPGASGQGRRVRAGHGGRVRVIPYGLRAGGGGLLRYESFIP